MARYETDAYLDRGKCPVCGNVRSLKDNGMLRVHGDPLRRLMNCQGSGRPPVDGTRKRPGEDCTCADCAKKEATR